MRTDGFNFVLLSFVDLFHVFPGVEPVEGLVGLAYCLVSTLAR